MSPATAAPHRLVRAAVLAAVMTAAGAGAHAAAGATVPVAALALVGAVLLGPAWLLTGRERGWTAIAGAQLAGQQVVHAVLESAAGAEHATMLPADVMLVSHLVAAALIAGVLRLGERRIWAAARRAALAVVLRWQRLLALFRGPGIGPVVAAAPAPVPARAGDRTLRHVVVRRGPPLLG